MPRPSRIKLSPWIESLILSYGSDPQVEEGGGSSSSSGGLKAHVIGVGPMSQSQAQGSEGPTALLFLSDEVLQIPAMLTASAWEHLQYHEERESLSSLLNTTVYIQNYRLQFHAAPEKTKSRFFLSVGELATTAAGPVKESTPCCTTLPSVRQKICKTWRLLLDQEMQESQRSQCGFDLSELLGEWQQDCLRTVLEDVRERLTTASRPQPSTSASSLTHPGALTATGWDVDRVRYKREKCFSVPVKCLLVPEEDALQPQTPPLSGSGTPSRLTAASEDSMGDSSESAQPSVDDAEWRIAQPAVLETVCDAKDDSPPPPADHSKDMIVGVIHSDIRPLTNPWDIFPPPGDTSSSSCSSPEDRPTHSPHDHAVAKSEPDHAAVLTSTQFPVQSSKEPLQTSEQSILPPYQLQLPTTSHHASVSSSTSSSVKTPEPFTRLSNLSPAADKHHTDPASNEESQEKRKSGKAKRKSSTPEAGVDGEEEEAEISRSPPSWLFDSEADGGAAQDSSQHQRQTMLRKTPTVHSDGKRFSYSYQASGQNLQDFSRFKVAGLWLQWAVKYLVVPKQTDNPHDTSATSNQTSSDRTGVISN
ncbi:hypothetical protein E3U43_004838 [Larimichthys crocea]|uniref:Uncharacterized protein n=1 Tax=Larimichthys crocea TaxID=215358 RepID=A0ACD3QGC5_LARCR|nr:hypothetical protein E3U43_004838 [Larimichthys crocea]